MPDDMGQQAVADAATAVATWFREVKGDPAGNRSETLYLQLALAVLIYTAQNAKQRIKERQSS